MSVKASFTCERATKRHKRIKRKEIAILCIV
jgi:hypothetical protein